MSFNVECDIWEGACFTNGYGAGTDQRGMTGRAHRIAYEREFGPIGVGRHIHHLCKTKLCVNPDHMISVTPKQHSSWFDARMGKTICKRGHCRTAESVDRHGHCRLCAALLARERRAVKRLSKELA